MSPASAGLIRTESAQLRRRLRKNQRVRSVLYDGSPAEELTKLNDRGDNDVQADLFEGPVWDDGEEVEPETPATSAGSDVGEDEDDVEAHASGFG